MILLDIAPLPIEKPVHVVRDTVDSFIVPVEQFSDTIQQPTHTNALIWSILTVAVALLILLFVARGYRRHVSLKDEQS